MINITATVGGIVMALKSDKTRILVNIPMKLKEELEKIALEDNRSVSNYVVTLIEKDIKEKNKKQLNKYLRCFFIFNHNVM